MRRLLEIEGDSANVRTNRKQTDLAL